MADEKTFHMTPDEFRKHGHAVVDWIADYTARIESYPVLSRAEPGQVRASSAIQSSIERRVFRSDPGRRRKTNSSRHNALAVTEFFRLLSRQRIGACDSW